MKLVSKAPIMVLLIISFSISVKAQEKLWNELYSKFSMFYQRGSFLYTPRYDTRTFVPTEKLDFVSGVGFPKGEKLKSGDVVEIEIEKIGRLTNPVKDEVT